MIQIRELFKKHWLRKIIKHVNLLAIAMILLVALILNLLRIYLPGTFSNQRAYFEQWASTAMHVPVKIKSIRVEWHHFSPMIAFGDVIILTNDAKPLIEIRELDIEINLLDSLLNWKLLPGMVVLDGAYLELHQSKDQQLSLDDISKSASKNLLKQTLSLNNTLTWLITQGTVIIQNVSVLWQRPDGVAVPIDKLNLQITQKGFGRSIVGNAILSNDLAHRVVFGATLKNIDLEKMQFDSNVYLSLNQMQLSSWAKLPLIASYLAKYKLTRGLANLQLWMTWKKMNLRLVQAQVNAEKLIVQTPVAKQKWVIGDLAANIAWKHHKKGWEVKANNIRAHINDEEWLDNAMGFEIFQETVEQAPYQLLAFKFLRLYDLKLMLAQIPGVNRELMKMLASINPQGTLNNFVLEHDGAGAWNVDTVKLSTNFIGVRAKPWDKWPGVSHLSGSLYWSPQLAHLEVASKDFSLTWPYIFSTPLKLNKLQTSLDYVLNQDQWSVKANSFLLDDANMLLTGQANFNHSLKGNKLSIDSKFKLNDVTEISPYLPQSIMDNDLYLWLSKAFKGGSISSGAFVFEGDPAAFPFRNREGHFQVLSNLKDIDLQFDPEWPAVEKINGQLFFDNFLMHVDQTSAVIAGNPITNINAVIPNLVQGLLLVEGQINSDLQDGLSYLENTPMSLGQKIQVLDMQGPMKLDLKLRIPLNSYARSHFKFATLGHLAVNNASINLLPLALELKNLKGQFDFTEDSLVAPHVSADLFTDPIEINIDTMTPKKGVPVAQFNFMGRFDMDHLQTKLQSKWLNFFHGSSVYQAQYNLNLGDTTEPNVFTLESNLQGINIDIDSLYKKQAKEAVKLECSAQIRSEDMPVLLGARYGDKLSMQLNLSRSHNELKLVSGEVALGSELAQQQTSPGFVFLFDLPDFKWEFWQSIIKKYTDLFAAGQTSSLDFLRMIHLKASNFELYDHRLKNVDLQLQPIETQWTAIIDSDSIAGKIILPRGVGSPSIKADLIRLYFSAKDAPKTDEVDFSAWPALELNVDDLRYADRGLGHLFWSSVPVPHGISINKLELSTLDYDLFMSGTSIETNKKYKTDVSGQVKSNNFGTLLTNLKITNALADADGIVDFSLHWLGSLAKPQLASITGFVDLNLHNGVIVNLSSGARSTIGFARLLNLFSLQILPSLSQLSKKGFDFTIMKSHFDLKNGNAIMSKALVDGPIARVMVKGRIGYVAEDYDVVMTVRPYVTSSLPALAGLAMANPVVGVVGWVVNKLVISPAVSRAVEFKYQVTGSWQKPTVIELEKAKVK